MGKDALMVLARFLLHRWRTPIGKGGIKKVDTKTM